MNAFETYKCYLAMKRHFTTDQYDYFMYNGSVNCSEKSFTSRRDVQGFLKASRHREPEKLLAANFIYGKMTWIGDIRQECYDHLIKMLDGGLYWLKSDLNKLKPDFNSNFFVGPEQAIPYIIQLVESNAIDMHTACVFEKMLSMDKRWANKPQYMIFQNMSVKIKKSVGFFDIDKNLTKYAAVIKQHFEQLNN